jgi:UDP-N-acetylglucosamine 2-epimerase (non-hydrolysing)
MAPVVTGLSRSAGVDSRVCVTGQHREMLDQVLDLFNIKPDYDLNIMKSGQDLTDVTNRVLTGLRVIFKEWAPDWVLVHGDTTTAMAASVAAYYLRIPVGHVEAGLRTGDIYSPWPEEVNRKIITSIATVHFAPTELSRVNLLNEGVSVGSIVLTGNTVVDAIHTVAEKINSDSNLEETLSNQFRQLDPRKKLILVTGHRRENHGHRLENICEALKVISKRSDIQIAYPVHLNPSVQEPVNRLLGRQENVFLFQPLEYIPFVYMMMKSYIILTDSGGVQEESLSLKKPVLVTRDTTERPEGVDCGGVKLVGTHTERIVECANTLLDDQDEYQKMLIKFSPYGDGNAAKRIVKYFASTQYRGREK